MYTYTYLGVMSWRRVLKSCQAVAAHGSLFTFTLILPLKLDHTLQNYSWWIIFSPVWLFHVVVARGRFSLPAPSMPHDRHWAPYHSIMATPLLVAFELLLCVYLEKSYAVDLKVVFLPLIAFETAILIDNIRMCRALMPGEHERMTDQAIWETLPHFWVAVSMVFCIAATFFTLLKLCGDVASLSWWDLFVTYCIAQFFAFLVWTTWYNPAIHRRHGVRTASSSSSSSSPTLNYLNWIAGLALSSDEDLQPRRLCSLQDIGWHVMKIPLIVFEILLVMHLEGTPASAQRIPLRFLFVPLLLLQGAGVLFAVYRLMEKVFLLLWNETASGSLVVFSFGLRDYLGFMHRGSRLLGWWSIDEASQVEQARLYHEGTSGYSTFTPDSVYKIPKSELAEEILRLQVVLGEQAEMCRYSQEEFERLQNDKILCRVCFEEEINTVLLPCRHHNLCSTCSAKCRRCPICRVIIQERLPVICV